MSPLEIKAALVLRRVKQADIARAVGHSPAFVNDVITGKRQSAAIQKAVAKAIGKSVREVFTASAA